MTSYTPAAVKHRFTVPVLPYCAVTAVIARNKTSAAADTSCMVELREQHRISFKDIGRIADRIGSKPDKLFNTVLSLFGEIIVKTACQVVDNAVAVLHYRCCDLNRT